jgi:ferric-dicitrate binding protein FerR (iron transport regulator)
MTEHDKELQSLLRQWEAPAPRAALDARVANSFRQSRRPGGRRWLSLAAGVFLLGVLGLHLLHRPEPVQARRESVSVATISDATGFQPVANGAITVTKGNQ